VLYLRAMATITLPTANKALDQLVHKLTDVAVSKAKQTGFVTAFRTRAYVEKNSDRLSGLSKREAEKSLPKNQS